MSIQHIKGIIKERGLEEFHLQDHHSVHFWYEFKGKASRTYTVNFHKDFIPEDLRKEGTEIWLGIKDNKPCVSKRTTNAVKTKE